MRMINYWRSDRWPESGSCELVAISVSQAKKHLRKKGGSAFTAFFDRKGVLLGTRKIEVENKEVTK